MAAELVSLHSPDLVDLDHATPENPDHFMALFQAEIAPENGRGGEIFSVKVCTPSWLQSEVELNPHGGLFLRHYLLVPRYDLAVIHDLIQRRCRAVSGKSWEEQAAYLGRYFLSEFEDYTE